MEAISPLMNGEDRKVDVKFKISLRRLQPAWLHAETPASRPLFNPPLGNDTLRI